jgi:hypothetical protein
MLGVYCLDVGSRGTFSWGTLRQAQDLADWGFAPHQLDGGAIQAICPLAQLARRPEMSTLGCRQRTAGPAGQVLQGHLFICP